MAFFAVAWKMFSDGAEMGEGGGRHPLGELLRHQLHFPPQNPGTSAKTNKGKEREGKGGQRGFGSRKKGRKRRKRRRLKDRKCEENEVKEKGQIMNY
jgi:hypothetical protein